MPKNSMLYEANSFDRISEFRNNAVLKALWLRFQPSIQMELPEFTVVIDRLQQFLQPVFDAAIHEREFFADWSAPRASGKYCACIQSTRLRNLP